MKVVVEVVDDTGLVPDHEAVRRLIEAVLEQEGIISGEVTVAFVDEACMADLNGRYRRAEGPTDVLAFDYADGLEPPSEAAATGATAGVADGELVVCPQAVIRYAQEDGREPVIQLGWTLVHGALHLAGYDHEIDQGEMREREQTLLRSLDGLVRMLSLGSGADAGRGGPR
jgi:probable rRNA maturation factor